MHSRFQQLSAVKICHTRLVRSAIIRKASQDEKQNQTTITLKNNKKNYLQKFMSICFKKKLLARSK